MQPEIDGQALERPCRLREVRRLHQTACRTDPPLPGKRHNRLVDSGFKSKIVGTNSNRDQRWHRGLLRRITHESDARLRGARYRGGAL